MGNVRVYELAREANMDSKDLTAKLIEMGYDVKSHSSTVEEQQAEEIRIKLGLKATKVETTRIQTKGRTTILRRRTTAVPQEELPEPEPVEEPETPAPAAAEAPSRGGAAAPAPPAEPAPAVEEEAGAAVSEEVAAEETAPAATGEEPPVEERAAEEATEVAEADADAAAQSDETVAAAPPAAAGDKGEEGEKAAASALVDRGRKGFAKIIKKAAIKIPQEAPRESPGARRPVGPRPPAAPRSAPAATAAPAAAKEADGAAKKGKRYVKFQQEPVVERDAGRRSASKRQSRIVVDIDEVADLGAALPANLRMGRMAGRGGKKGKKQVVVQASTMAPKAIKRRIKVAEFISVGDLAHRMGVKAGELIRKLISFGTMATVNQALDVDTAALIADEFGYEVERATTEVDVMENLETKEAGGEEMPRPPVVTVMGHVDHGKTSILDAIRQTDVAAGEAGGITQHIGAHYVRSAQGDVVFLDTPGHAAFTEMRSRGAKVTDIVVLVVAADDGVMEQTKEAINHAKAAGVPIVVAVNKIDKPDSDPMRVMRELSEFGLMPEEWGGDTIFCQTSAKQKIGIEELLEQILLQAEVLELKADPKRKARGRVIEARLHKGRGATATVLVQHGTLRLGDAFVIGSYSGKVRALFNDKGQPVDEAGPAVPVEVQGLSGVPQAGDEFIVVADEKMAKNISSERQMKSRELELASASKISLDNLFDKMKEGEMKELLVVLRADVQGTLEAFSSSLTKLSTDAVRLKIIHEGTGTITESDVLLAAASDAIIIGFNVRATGKVAELAKKENVDLRFYDVIYHAMEDIQKAMVGLLEPTFEEKVIGTLEVRDTFHVPKVGTIAGCYVTSGKAVRNGRVRLIREGVVVYTGRVGSLKRFKDDAREVATGYECGLGIENYNDIRTGDTLEVFVLEEVAAEL
ncbi:MAG: translation initiation factor IF-2 [Thermodesulfobacteriota bacterium]